MSLLKVTPLKHRFSSSTWRYVNSQNTKVYFKHIHYIDELAKFDRYNECA